MEVLTLVGLMAAGVKLVSVIKMKFPDIPGWLVQFIAWGVTMALVFLGAEMQVIGDTEVNGVALAQMEFWTKFGVGFILGSGGSLLVDAYTAVDPNKTTKV